MSAVLTCVLRPGVWLRAMWLALVVLTTEAVVQRRRARRERRAEPPETGPVQTV